jgi:hypothetical protein
MTVYPDERYSSGTIKKTSKKENLMISTASNGNDISKKGAEYKQQFLREFNQYLAVQHPAIRGLHMVLKGLAMVCLGLSIIFFIVAMYNTFLWAATGSFSSLGQAASLPIAWVNFGLSCSFLVFPWGLDAMLMRSFPTDAFLPYAYGTARGQGKPIRFTTGLGAFFAGFGIMCAGAPGAAIVVPVIWQFILALF